VERSVRVLIVDDFAPFRHFVCSKLEGLPGLQLIGEAEDGLEAVRKAQELRPDLILLDIGLPGLNGIQAARQILKLSPPPRILFVSENRSKDIAQEALRSGAGGYVVKSDAANELLPAVESVLQDMPFVSASLVGRVFVNPAETRAADCPDRNADVPQVCKQNGGAKRQHEVGFYSDDCSLLEDAAQFIGTSLKAGDSVIVAATELHRESILPRLQASDLDIGSAIEKGRYVALDAAEALSMFMLDNKLDPARFLSAFGNLIQTSARAADPEHSRVAIIGECADLLIAQGNGEAALQAEKLVNQMLKSCDANIFCWYSLDPPMDDNLYEQICAEHTFVRRPRA
jgi:DNA-binding NarL/FixJ family response regulator